MISTILPQVNFSKAPSKLRVERIVASEALNGIMRDWDLLAGDIPFRRPAWLLSWWRHYRRPGDELCVLAVRDGRDRVVAIVPWFVQQSPWLGRVVRFLGSGKVSTDYATVLCGGDHTREVAEAIADYLTDSDGGHWDAIELSGVDREDVAVAALAEALRRRDCAVDVRSPYSCWRVDLPASWDAYLATLSKSRRERVRQLCRRRFETGRAVTRYVERAEDLPIALGHLHKLHELRRKSLGGHGCFSSPRFAGFLEEVAERFLANGGLRLQWTELDGRVVAAEFDLLGGNTVYYYQSGIDPADQAERPGWLSTIGALKWAIEAGYETYDFLRGDYDFKTHWRGRPRPLCELRIVPPTLAARLRHQAWCGAQRGKQLLKQGLDQSGWARLRHRFRDLYPQAASYLQRKAAEPRATMRND